MPKRSLMLAGGGLKIAFQAGVLQVWLDEAGLEFDHADAVSAACFNLAMWTQGMSGTRIADNWRNLDPVAGVDLNWPQLARLLYAESLFDLDKYRTKVFPSWGLDFEKIRASQREATFNVYNFSKHELRPVPTPELTEDFLVATGSLSIWLPPVRIGGDTYIDAIFNTPTNIEEAIRRGSDELWIIWTTSQCGEWFDGFVGGFFGIFEAATNHAYKQSLARIASNNDAIAQGRDGEYGRVITVREIKAEVPVHYLLNFSRDRAREAVNRGVEAARAWCDKQGIPRGSAIPDTTQTGSAITGLRFSETLKGYVTFGAEDYQQGFEHGREQNGRIEVELHTHVEDVDRFITMPEHVARVEGSLVCEKLGGKSEFDRGAFQLFVDQGDPARKKVIYECVFRDPNGGLYTLYGFRDLHAHSEHETTGDPAVLFVAVLAGDAPYGQDGRPALAMGLLRAGTIDFLKHIASFQAEGITLTDRAQALSRFGAFYLGQLWDVYARNLLPSAPF